MRLTRRQRKERKARGLSVEPTVLEPSRSLFDTLDRIMPREILAPLNEADAQEIRDMSAGRALSLYPSNTRHDWGVGPIPAASAWAPRHGGGATLTVGGVDVVEIEPLGPGWWVSAGHAGSDGVNGTLQEAKARALEMLGGVVT